MSKLLYLEGSPRKELSFSARVCRAFLEAYHETHPQDEIETWDLFKIDLPVFDGFTLQAKYTVLHGQHPTAEEATAWKAVEAVIGRFTSADKYLLGVPMWNFGIPYRLKHFLDVIVQPGYTFTFSAGAGYRGLVTGKPIMVVYARGGAYPPDSPTASLDFQKKYMELLLGFIGFANQMSIVIEPTEGAPEEVSSRLESALAAARKAARTF